MKHYIFICVFGVVMALAGCAESSALIASRDHSDHVDIFRVQEENSPPPAGYVDLKISAVVKTHLAGFYSSTDPHGTDAYELLVNIDGQSMRMRGSRANEIKQDLTMGDPEGGTGTKYLFQSTIRLKEGRHTAVVALPVEDVAVRKELTLNAGRQSRLVLQPVYGTTIRKLGVGNPLKESFQAGVKTLRLVLNGSDM
ncbi:hypothetical protein KP003_10520 [Geomonas nitrogeniifigens]|uniref:hypothetical protein n=1 Tax=Geomonas diazotrophica TaxID=2843197 RepID=UPI001C2BE7E3|nr:hypothetical protein [Geomonas nitrogeniifigens]QXE84843.1 hypothetical protein KP003_10520 [Geomonas nitrogeniifigens]